MGTDSEIPAFRIRANLGLAIAAVLFLSPFAVNNFLQDRPLLGIGSLAIVVIMAFKAILMRRGQYSEALSILVLAPIILIFLSMSLWNQGVIGVLWSYPAMMAFFILLSERKAWIANAILVLVVVSQAWWLLDEGLVLRTAATLVTVGAFTAIFIRAISTAHQELQRLSITDPLTGLKNRSTLAAALARAIEQNRRSNIPVSLLALDIDHFKAINDKYGHATGDRVLVGVADLLTSRLRLNDEIYRVGGEEFLVLLSNTAAATAREIGEEIRSTLEHSDLLEDQPLTVSIGVAGINPDEQPESWMQRADQNLYRAKQEGRNRVIA